MRLVCAGRRLRTCVRPLAGLLRGAGQLRRLTLHHARRPPAVTHTHVLHISQTVLTRQVRQLSVVYAPVLARRGAQISLWHSTLLVPVVLRAAQRQARGEWRALLRPAAAARTVRVLAPAFSQLFRRMIEEEQRYYHTRPTQTRQLLWRLLGARSTLHLLTQFYAGEVPYHTLGGMGGTVAARLLPAVLGGGRLPDAGERRADPALRLLQGQKETLKLSYHRQTRETLRADAGAKTRDEAASSAPRAYAPEAPRLSEQEMRHIVQRVFRELARGHARDRLRGKE